MIYNLNNINEQSFKNEPYNLIIIGSGPAGLSLAYALRNTGKRIAVMEAGGENYSTESLEPYKGSVVGDKYFNLQAARQRFFGGTSNHWSGMCRPLDDYDFKYKSIIITMMQLKEETLLPHVQHCSNKKNSGCDSTEAADTNRYQQLPTDTTGLYSSPVYSSVVESNRV